MTPRHPPRALRSLTTPTRPPPIARERPSRGAAVTPRSRLCRGRRRLATRRPPIFRVTIPCAGRPAPRRADPRSVRVHVRGETWIVPLPRCRLRLTCLRDQPPDCQRARGRDADRGEARTRPASALAAGQGARPSRATAPPRTQRGDGIAEQTRDRAPGDPGRAVRRSIGRRSCVDANPRGEPASGRPARRGRCRCGLASGRRPGTSPGGLRPRAGIFQGNP